MCEGAACSGHCAMPRCGSISALCSCRVNCTSSGYQGWIVNEALGPQYITSTYVGVGKRMEKANPSGQKCVWFISLSES